MNRGPAVNAFQGSVSPSLLPAEFGGKLSLEEPDRELLNDPSLTENYGDLLKVKPNKPTEHEDESNSGSVVVTGGSPTKKINSQNSHNNNNNTNTKNNNNNSNNSNNSNNNDDNNKINNNSNINSNGNSNGNNNGNIRFNENSNNDNDGSSNYYETNSNSESENNRDQEYDYSDSDFEENLEKRLQDMDTDLPGEKSVRGNGGSHGSESIYDGLMMALSEDEDDLHLEDEEDVENVEIEDDLFEDDELQSLPPPQELDPDKLYALYAFNGPDPSHCQLKQDEACTLLNDQDSYWWLVRRYGDSKIGFAPAEILETYPERLARLNCWKNETISLKKNSTASGFDDQTSEDRTTTDERTEFDNGKNFQSNKDDDSSINGSNSGGVDNEEEDKTAHEVDHRHSDGSIDGSHRLALKEYGKGNKSVSFNDVVSYADRYIQDSDEESEYDADEPTQYDEFSESKLRMGRIGEDDENDVGADMDFDDDDMSEANSDASFNTASMVPLNIEKRRQPSPPQPPSSPPPHTEVQMRKTSSDEEIVKGINENRNSFIETHDNRNEVDEEQQDGLHKIFEAPVLPFGRKNSHFDSANRDSISIGEFSPSSSEWTNDSPQQQQLAGNQSPNPIPPSRAIQDLTKIVDTEDDSSTSAGRIVDLNSRNVQEPKLQQSGQSRGGLRQQQNQRQNQVHSKETPGSSSSSSEEIFMEAERAGSSTSVNSAYSVSRQLFHSSSVVSTTTVKHHPIIDRLYDPIFTRMDDLLKQINEAGK